MQRRMERFIEIIVGAAKSCLLLLILISPLLILISATSHIRGDGAVGLAYLVFVAAYYLWPVALLFLVGTIALTYLWVRDKGIQPIGAYAPYAAIFLFWAASAALPYSVEFHPGPEWKQDGITAVGFWDDQSDGSAASLVLGTFLVERYLVLQKNSPIDHPTIKEAFVRKSGAACDIQDPNVELALMQSSGHFEACVVRDVDDTVLNGAIVIRKGPYLLKGEKQGPAAIAYRLQAGRAPEEIGRWEVVRRPKPVRTHINDVSYVFDIAGPTATKRYDAWKFTLGQWVDLAHPWVMKTRIDSDLPFAVTMASEQGRALYSPILQRDFKKYPVIGTDLTPEQKQKFNDIAAAACRWQLNIDKTRYIYGEPRAGCKQTYAAWFR